ncbi:MAG: glucan biosynthesis protein G, partial [Crocinitomicaceae bacterium]|nr:glucan biosynthesis protein G [Crocinitomicaceae bacterium]
FWYGESTPSLIPPYPESHDSDGLLILDKDQFFWIPLENPKKPTNTTFPVKNLKGLRCEVIVIDYESLESYKHT